MYQLPMLQWGRDVSIPEIVPALYQEMRSAVLQWGRDVSIPEIRLRPKASRRYPAASMGPGCFYPGNPDHWYEDIVGMALQWGRDVSIPEIISYSGISIAKGSLQWGRDVSIPEMSRPWHRRRRQYGFNGAGMFLSRKSTVRHR